MPSSSRRVRRSGYEAKSRNAPVSARKLKECTACPLETSANARRSSVRRLGTLALQERPLTRDRGGDKFGERANACGPTQILVGQNPQRRGHRRDRRANADQIVRAVAEIAG